MSACLGQGLSFQGSSRQDKLQDPPSSKLLAQICQAHLGVLLASPPSILSSSNTLVPFGCLFSASGSRRVDWWKQHGAPPWVFFFLVEVFHGWSCLTLSLHLVYLTPPHTMLTHKLDFYNSKTCLPAEYRISHCTADFHHALNPRLLSHLCGL